MRARAASAASILLPILASAAGCGGGGVQVAPVATLSTSPEAEVAFAPIRAGWERQTRAGRLQLRAPLERFLAAYPRDGIAPLARAYYVFVLMDAGDFTRAQFLLRALEVTTPPGATRDLVTIARAKLLRVTGQPEAAFDLLRPLVGKLVDPASRALFQEEVSLAAIEAHRDYEAIAYMDAWLRNVPEEEHDAVRAKVTGALAKLPPSVLEGALRTMRARGAASGYGREIQRLVSERLAEVAIARGDPDLARWLLSGEGGPALVGGSEGALGELATARRGVTSVDGRLVGLLLPTGSNDLRDEAAAVMRGAANALDLPRRDPGAGDATKLATRDDGGDPARVPSMLSELAGEGAAVILAALDPASADRAVQWSEEHAVPVIVLAAPARVPPSSWGFVAGEPRVNELAALAHALVDRGAARVAPVVASANDPALTVVADAGLTLLAPASCGGDPERAGETRFPAAAWTSDRVRTWMVDGPPECARDLILDLGARAATGTVALTLDASGTRARARGLTLLGVAAGAIPVTGPSDAIADAALRQWVDHEGVAPTWWTALGHDAALLARSAVRDLPRDATTDATEAARRRRAVRDALAAARASLWTTRADGFGGGHALPRMLQAVELPNAPAPSSRASGAHANANAHADPNANAAAGGGR